MNSSSSAESGPLSSSRPPCRAGGGGGATGGSGGAAAGRGPPRSRPGSPLLLAEPAELGAVLLVVRLELDQHLEDRGGLVEAAAREVGLDHLRVGLRHQHVVPRLPVELDELGQAADVGGVALDDLLEERRSAVDLPPLHELVHRGLQVLEGLVVAALGEVHLAELQARLLVGGVALEQALEHLARSSGRFAPRQASREPQRHLAVGGGGPPRLLQVLDRPRVVLLDEAHAGVGGEQARAAGPGAEGLLDELQRLGEVALLDELLGDGHVLARGLLRVALPGVELGQADADLHVRRVHLGQLPEDLPRLALLARA